MGGESEKEVGDVGIPTTRFSTRWGNIQCTSTAGILQRPPKSVRPGPIFTKQRVCVSTGGGWTP